MKKTKDDVKLVNVSARIPKYLRKLVNDMANKEDRKFSYMLRKILEEKFNKA